MNSPLTYSPRLGRAIRTDGIATLGTSTQTLVEEAVTGAAWEVAADLATYYSQELRRIGQALFTWMDDIVAFGLEQAAVGDPARAATWLLAGLRDFDPSSGDLERTLDRVAARDAEGAVAAIELLRVRWGSLHDTLVHWIQELLAGLARDAGEDAVFAVVERTYERLWQRRYADWDDMTPMERLQLSVEGMRGHMSGAGRRGDVGIVEEPDRYVMILDPCGSCGILRRGDPDSGRMPANPEGNRVAHPWTWGRTGVGWYAVHSPIVMEYLHLRRGEPPLRPLEDCDLAGLPCRWFIYRERGATRPEHAARMGFAAGTGGRA